MTKPILKRTEKRRSFNWAYWVPTIGIAAPFVFVWLKPTRLLAIITILVLVGSAVYPLMQLLQRNVKAGISSVAVALILVAGFGFLIWPRNASNPVPQVEAIPCPPGVGPDIKGFTANGVTVGVELKNNPCVHLKDVHIYNGKIGLEADGVPQKKP